MRTEIQKYPAYKDSGVEWLGEIPCHWEVKKLKFIGNIYAGLNGKKGDDFTKEFSSGIKSYIPFTNICNNLKISENQFHFVKVNENEKQNKVLIYDILFLMSSETLEDIGKNSIYVGNNEELYLNSFCKGFRILSNRVNPEYVNYLFSSLTYRSYFSLVGRGFTRINLKQEFINDSFALLPPLSEQTAIAAFLDRKTALIDQAIDIKQKQIELLKERRQILIHKAVTRGLNPNVKMKDSGVEWIGEVPVGWEVKRLKYILNINNGADYKHVQSDDGFPVIGSGGQFAYASKYMYDGEVVFLGRKGTVDKPLYYFGKFWAVDTMFYAIPKNKNNVRFLYYVATTIPFKFYSTATALPSMTQSDLNNHMVSLPSIEEQNVIVKYIVETTRKIDTAISLKEQELEKLKEYKGTLINSAVTGKVKV